jgi:hypothetical protein
MFELAWIWKLVWIWIENLEKINRKAIPKSLEKKKTHFGPIGLISPAARACPRPRAPGLRQADPACRHRPAPLFLSPSCCSVGSPCRCFGPSSARTSVPLSRGPHSPVPSPLLQPLTCADHTHACRDRRAHVATQLQTGNPTPSTSPHTPPPPPASHISPLPTHPSCAHPFFKLAGASPSPGLLRPNPPPSVTVLHHRQAQPRHYSRPTWGEFPRRTFFSLSPVFFDHSITCQWSPVPVPPRQTETPRPTATAPCVAEPPKSFQLKCLSHASGAVTHLNRNNPSVPQI